VCVCMCVNDWNGMRESRGEERRGDCSITMMRRMDNGVIGN